MADYFNLPKEKARQNILAGLLKSLQDTEAYVRLVSIVARMFKAPFAGMSMMHDKSHRLIALIGLSVKEVPREQGLCALSYVDEKAPILVILNALTNDLSKEHPMVKDTLNIRFYVSASIFIEGVKVGCLFLADTVTRPCFSEKDQEIMIEMANTISELLLSHHRQHWQSQLQEVALPSQMLQSVQAPMKDVNDDLKALEDTVNCLQSATQIAQSAQTVQSASEQTELLTARAHQLRLSVAQLTTAIDNAIRRLIHYISRPSPYSSSANSFSFKRGLSPASMSRPISSDNLSTLTSPTAPSDQSSS